MRTLAILVALALSGQTAAPQPEPFTEVEALRVENVRLESLVLQRQLDDFRAKRAKLTADLEAKRPGWRYDAEAGTFSPRKE